MDSSQITPVLDSIDKKILRALQADGRISNADLAKEIGQESRRLLESHQTSFR